MRKSSQVWIPILLVAFATVAASAQSFRVQCPTSTITHPDPNNTGVNNSESPYNGPTQLPFFSITSITVSGTTATATVAGTLPTLTGSITAAISGVGLTASVPPASVNFTGTYQITVTGGASTFTFTAPTGVAAGTYSVTNGYVTSNVNGAIKCQQVSGGDGYMTEADGNQTFMFSFGPLSGLADIAAGLPGTQFPNVFNTSYTSPTVHGAPATITAASAALNTTTNVATVTITSTLNPRVNDGVTIAGITPAPYDGTFTVLTTSPTSFTYSFAAPTGLSTSLTLATATAQDFSGPTRGDPATTDGATTGASPGVAMPTSTTPPAFTWNGAVGLTPEIAYIVTVADLVEGPVTAALYPGATVPGCPTTTASANTVTGWTDSSALFTIPVGSQVVISNGLGDDGTPTPSGYAGTWTVTCVATGAGLSPDGVYSAVFQYTDTNTGLAADTGNDEAAVAATPSATDGHVDPRQVMDVGVMNGNIPGPLVAFDEDDEMFLTLSNVGMIMRPDLFEQHTFHFHGYPNASSFYDGVPDASIAINIGASFTYYYMAPDAGTYFYHCHITPPEHLQMGMVNQLHVRPRQDRVPQTGNLYTYLGYQNGISEPASNPVADLRTECNPGRDILCSATMPSVQNPNTTLPRSGTVPTSGVQGLDLVGNTQRYVYNDGDGSTAYDVEYPIQMHGFDPNFHFVGMTFNPELFVDMKDKYFLLNGRSYPDTVGACGATATGHYAPGCVAGPQATVSSDAQMHYSQPLPAVVNIPVGGKALLRLVNLSVTEYHTLQSLGIPMKEVGFMAKLLRDQAGNNTEFYTNSITLGGGESLDVILDASDDSCSGYAGSGCSATLYPAGSTFYLYTPQLDHLSNDAENFGGMMTEVHICNSVTTGALPNPKTQYPNPPGSTFGNTCN